MDAQIIGLAAEIKVAEDSREVVLLAHPGQRPFVAVGRAIVTPEALVVGPLRARRAFCAESMPAPLGEQFMQPRAIESRGNVVREAGDLAVLPMIFERVEQAAGPSRAALEKSE